MADIKRDFNADRTLCDAATDGPWTYDYELEIDFDDVYEFIRFNEIAIKNLTDEDARFIAEARTGWPAALEHIRALEGEIERIRALLEEVYQAAQNDVNRWEGGQCVGTQRFLDRRLAKRIVTEVSANAKTES